MIVNNTSIASVAAVPMQGIYNSSKAAAAALTDNMRIELAPFNIRVVDLRTGSVQSNFRDNLPVEPVLPKTSIYAPAREEVEKVMLGETLPPSISAQGWAEQVVRDLLSSKPPTHIWRGQGAWMVWFVRRFLPYTFPDAILSKMGKMEVVKEKVARGTQGQSLSVLSRIVARIVGV